MNLFFINGDENFMVLTKYQEGSVGELWTISFPLMLSSFSVMLMLFVDRMMLAHYSTEALNAAVLAQTFGWAFVLGWTVLTSISEVFVAQYNGSNQPHRLGEPTWQMIWAGLGSALFFVPMAIWGGQLAYGTGAEKVMEREYFFWMMCFGPSFAIYTALAGFFVGQGKTRLITVVVCSANIVNAVLDGSLIFGIEGWVAPLGIKGAAIATSCSSVFQAIILAVIFLKKKNRQQYGTAKYAFNFSLMKDCLKIGLPGAIFMMVEILGWAAYYMIMVFAGEVDITIAGICQSIVILFYFFAEGLGKGVTAVAGNFIGARHFWAIQKTMRSGVVLNILFFLCLGAFFAFGSDLTIHLFLPDLSSAELEKIYQPLLVSLACILIYIFFEGVRFLLAGLLTAYGDTMFLLIAGSLSVWFMLILPVYLSVTKWNLGVQTASFISVCYGSSACLIYYWRVQQERWQGKTLID